jgi:hypothetical protein
LEASLSVYGADVVAEFAVDYCYANAPALAPAARVAWQAWRKKFLVAEVSRHIDAKTMAGMRESLAPSRATLHEELARQGTPAAVCQQMPSSFSDADMDIRTLYPVAYDPKARQVQPLLAAPSAPPVAVAPAPKPGQPAFPAPPVSSVQRPVGTVFSLSQLQLFLDEGTIEQRRTRLNLPLFLKGKVIRRGNTLQIEQNDGAFGAGMQVAPNIDLRALEGQELVLTGSFSELPGTLAQLRGAQVVADPSLLKPSTLRTDYKLSRNYVYPRQIRTAPNQGIPAKDIEAVMFQRDHPMILLKDGWMYARKSDIPPSDLNVALSRELEPQHWRPWKRVNGSYQMRYTDQYGKPSGDWVKVPGWEVKPWPKTPMSLFVLKASFTGSIGLGGTYQQDTWYFQTSGRFESKGYTQSSAGSWAAANGYSSAQTTIRGGDGTRSTSSVLAGGAPATSTQGGGSSFTEGRRINDGSNYKGTYTIDGFTLDLRYDSGRMERVMAFPWSGSGATYIDGDTYLQQK